MTHPRLKALVRGQRGFTLIEMLVVVVLIGIIAAGIAMTISQVMAVNSRTSSKMVALRQVQQAGDRVSKDVLQASGVNPDSADGTGFPLELTIPYWTYNATGGLEMSQYKVVYKLVEDELRREYYSDINGEPDFTTIVAQYIIRFDPDTLEIKTSFRLDESDGGGGSTVAYIFEVTASVGLYTETREYEIKPRPGS